jgi:pimeloyl-ACP methyl ester carboxylesterase
VLATLGSSDWVGEKTGQGDPRVIALHGWGRSGADFHTILEGHDAMALHLPGFGPTTPPPAAWSPAEYADNLAHALGDLPPVVLVGHSFGGRIAVRLAARHPERVKALVLTGVPLTRIGQRSKPALAFRVARALHAARLLPEAVMESFRQKYGSADYRAATGVMRQILVTAVSEDYLDDATRVSQPVIMVWGELDRAAPLAAAQKTLDYFPNATLRVVPQASHLLEGSLEAGVAAAVSDASNL